ncbi:hypothetical protein [Amycolatopsis plumensis]|uniref:hypothetical protein n=1 Tax=Amycolatopsis plumensis TaxID=236508 RepID=UPI00361A8891
MTAGKTGPAGRASRQAGSPTPDEESHRTRIPPVRDYRDVKNADTPSEIRP